MRFGGRTRDIVAEDDPPHAKDDVEAFDRGTRRMHALAQPPAQAIPVDGAWHHLAPDDVADAARILDGRRGNQLQEMRVVTDTVPEYRFVRAGAAQPMGRTPDARSGRQLDQTDRRARPLARRAARTLRPPTVLMRARKPCVRARRSFDGWYVRFIVGAFGGAKSADRRSDSVLLPTKSLTLERVTHRMSM